MSERPDVYLVLIFPDSSESRWDWEPPRIGSEIKSRFGKNWRVEEVMQSGADVYTVHCGPSQQSLAADLLDRARETLSPRRRRGRERIP